MTPKRALRLSRYVSQLLMLVTVGGVILGGCKPKQNAMLVASISRVQAFLGPSGLDWKNYDIYEYHDTQRFPISADDYGAPVSIFAAPDLGTSSVSDYETPSGKIVAVAYIPDNPTSLPALYTDIGLNADFTCIVLRHEVSGGGWKAFAVQSQGRICPTSTTEPTRKDLSVLRDDASVWSAADYPPVARFQVTQNGAIAYGVRCADRWCVIGLKSGDSPAEAEHVNAAGEVSSKRSRIPGWYDDQVLGVITGNVFKHKLKPQMRASVIPEEGIATWTATNYQTADGKFVARVYVKGPVADHYKEAGLKQGWNDLYLRQGTGADTSWSARFVQGHVGNGPWLKVLRTDHHGHAVPATARWAWADLDEEIWVACDEGCCRVQGQIQ